MNIAFVQLVEGVEAEASVKCLTLALGDSTTCHQRHYQAYMKQARSHFLLFLNRNVLVRKKFCKLTIFFGIFASYSNLYI